MVGRGIQYGYISTGQAFVFLYIPDDPTIVYYNLCVPNLDLPDDDDETKLHRTAVAQVFAFVLQSLRAEPPPLSWHDAAAKQLDTWAVEYDDILSRIPETVRKAKPSPSPYKPQHWRGFNRSPIKLRSRCQQTDLQANPKGDASSSDESAPPPSPTLRRSTRSTRKAAAPTSDAGKTCAQRGRGGGGQGGRIQDRPYCTHQCLFGLTHGGPIDRRCPNAQIHGVRHIGRANFLRLLQAQLDSDRGPDADCAPLYLAGAIGALFKLRLSSHGYTLVAKGAENRHLARLQHEAEIYQSLHDVQGWCVPVCVGLVDLVLPLYYDGKVFKDLMLLSFAGRPLLNCMCQLDRALTVDLVSSAFAQLHRLRVRHGDAEARNIMYDDSGPTIMIVDFERAEFFGRQPLSSISANSTKRKRKREVAQKQDDDMFAKELRSVIGEISRCLSHVI